MAKVAIAGACTQSTGVFVAELYRRLYQTQTNTNTRGFGGGGVPFIGR